MALLDFLSALAPIAGAQMPIQSIDPNSALGMAPGGPSPEFLKAFAGMDNTAGPPSAANPAMPNPPPLAQPPAPDAPAPAMGGMVDTSGAMNAAMAPPDGTTPAAAAPAPPASPPIAAAPPAIAPAKSGGHGFRDFLGQLGDVLLVANGGQPIYTPKMQQRKLGEAMASYLGDPNLAQIALQDPNAAYKFYGDKREDQRFDRTAGQEDQRIGISADDAATRRGGLYEESRHNQATEGLTQRGQDTQAAIQTKLGQLRMAEAAAQREYAAALHRGDQAHAEKMLGLQTEAARQQELLKYQLSQMGGSGGEQTTETINPDGTSKTTTKVKLPAAVHVNDEASYKALPSGSTFVGPDGKTYRKP